MAKQRVSALAKEVGLPSKQLIEWLNNNGEYVKTPSSTIEAPVVAKVLAAVPEGPRGPAEAGDEDRSEEDRRGGPKAEAPAPAVAEPAPVVEPEPPAFAPTEEVFPPRRTADRRARGARGAVRRAAGATSRRATPGGQQPVHRRARGQQPVHHA